MNRKGPLARRQADRYAAAVERVMRTGEAVMDRIAELSRTDAKLRRLIAESDAAEKAVKEFRV